jgi:hypothetical protein
LLLYNYNVGIVVLNPNVVGLTMYMLTPNFVSEAMKKRRQEPLQWVPDHHHPEALLQVRHERYRLGKILQA